MTEEPPWKNDSGYNAVTLVIECNNCEYLDKLSVWLPEVIVVQDYKIKKNCLRCNHSDWNVDV